MSSFHKSLNFGQYIPNDKVLNRKVPENPRYKHVKPAVDTGKNVKRQIDELKEKQKNINHKKDEVFNRIKFSAFVKLAICVAKEQLQDREEVTEVEVENRSEVPKSGSKMANVLIGIGEIDLRNEKLKPQKNLPRIEKIVPYLLLDVRDRDQFSKCHIKTAKHYPAAMLSRSTCYELDEMKLYKNNRPELIVLYDEDESIATRVATTLVQRGYENIYVLSGGLKLGHDVLPRALMDVITTSDCNTSNLGPTATVQFKSASTESFTPEDIERAQQYIEDCQLKSKTPAGSSSSFFSQSKCKNVSLCPPKSADSTIPSYKQGSLTYRKDSARSTKSTDCIQQQVDISTKTVDPLRFRIDSRDSPVNRGNKVVKKAPWK